MSVNVLVADKFPEEKIANLKEQECNVIYDQSLKEDVKWALLGDIREGVHYTTSVLHCRI